ncbi:MAG: TetR/AcrR family transcriptional regulator [Maritimibacter sp.]
MSSENPNTQTRILDAAWTLLETGGSKVRMSDIAKAAGVSRQAVYLHFASRAELLIATTRHIDAVKDVDARLAASRAASSGLERLDHYIDAWCGYIPEIYGVGRALMAMQDSDEDARDAWVNRMNAMHHGCVAVAKMLADEDKLRPGLSVSHAADLLAMLLSVRGWEDLVTTRGWSQPDYIEEMKTLARRALVQ